MRAEAHNILSSGLVLESRLTSRPKQSSQIMSVAPLETREFVG